VRRQSQNFRQQHKLRRISAPITGIVRFSGRKASLEFIDPLNADSITLNKQSFPLAADFDAPTALLIARERPRTPGALTGHEPPTLCRYGDAYPLAAIRSRARPCDLRSRPSRKWMRAGRQ